jgi:hypothetical protein
MSLKNSKIGDLIYSATHETIAECISENPSYFLDIAGKYEHKIRCAPWPFTEIDKIEPELENYFWSIIDEAYVPLNYKDLILYSYLRHKSSRFFEILKENY